MSKIIVLALLLCILLGNFHNNTAMAVRSKTVTNGRQAPAEFNISKVHIRKCRCKALPNRQLKCPSPLFPTVKAEQQDLLKCLCSKTNHRHKFQKDCMSWQYNFLL